MKMLLYSCKAKPYLIQGFTRPMHTVDRNNPFNYNWSLINHKSQNALNGKIVGECDFEVEEIYCDITYNGVGKDYHYYLENGDVFYMESCLTPNDLLDYLGYKNDGYDVGYAIHIKNLHIFDEPKELNEVYSIHNVGGMLLTDKLKKAPQNMQRISVKEWEYGTYNPNDIAILISISSECLCKILNDEKTIIIKKKVLKEML